MIFFLECFENGADINLDSGKLLEFLVNKGYLEKIIILSNKGPILIYHRYTTNCC
jgi:hypothetical protein